MQTLFTVERFYRPDFHRGTLQDGFSQRTETGCIKKIKDSMHRNMKLTFQNVFIGEFVKKTRHLNERNAA